MTLFPRLLLASAALLVFTAPGLAQSMQGMDHSSMPGMPKPKKPAAKSAQPAAKVPPAPRPTRKPATVSKIKQQNKAPSPLAPARPAQQPPADPNAMQNMDHGAMPGMAGEAGTQSPASECTAEHAKMGHCTPSVDEPGPAMPASGSVSAQDDGHQAMPGMTMSESPSGEVAIDPDCPPEHAKMGHCTPKASSAIPMPDGKAATGTDLEPGNAPAPAPPSDWYADRIFPSDEMKRTREEMMKESGGRNLSFVSFNLAEYQARQGRDGFRWEGQGWYGGDINRVTIKTEGEGAFGKGLDKAEVQLLYSRAIDPFFNLQAGVRQDLGAGPKRTYAVAGFEGLAPYWFEVEGALFLSNRGDFLGRIAGYYDQRITQKLILQPRAEFNIAAQDIPESGIGSGLSDVELGLRLRYEIVKEFAPYVGIEWARKVGNTARFTRLAGEDPNVTNFVAGIRIWF